MPQLLPVVGPLKTEVKDLLRRRTSKLTQASFDTDRIGQPGVANAATNTMGNDRSASGAGSSAMKETLHGNFGVGLSDRQVH